MVQKQKPNAFFWHKNIKKIVSAVTIFFYLLSINISFIQLGFTQTYAEDEVQDSIPVVEETPIAPVEDVQPLVEEGASAETENSVETPVEESIPEEEVPTSEEIIPTEEVISTDEVPTEDVPSEEIIPTLDEEETLSGILEQQGVVEETSQEETSTGDIIEAQEEVIDAIEVIEGSLSGAVDQVEEILEVAPIVIPVEVSQATQEALTDNKMTIGKVEDTVIVTATEDIFLAATSYLGFITEVEVTIPEGTQITSSDKEVFPIENLEVVSTDDATLISEETQKQEQFVSEGEKLIDFGVEGEHLLFSQPVEIRASVDMTDGSLVDIAVKHMGDESYNTSGLSISPEATCDLNSQSSIPGNKAFVTNGEVVFYTCGASSFTVTPSAGTATITTPTTGSTVNTTTPTFQGTGDTQGATVTLVYNGTSVVLGTGTVNAGTWSITPDLSLGNGSHTVCISGGGSCTTFTIQVSEIIYDGVNSGIGGDDVASTSKSLGFSFSHYGTSYSNAYLTTNGVLNFATSGFTTYSNVVLSNSSAASNSLYPYWDDIITQDGLTGSPKQSIYYQTVGTSPNRKFIAQWTNMYFYDEPTLPMGTFQAILYEGSNIIRFQYRDLLGGSKSQGQFATIGIKKDNSTYSQYSHNTTSISLKQAICYIPSGASSYTVNTSCGYDPVYLNAPGNPVPPPIINPASGVTNTTLTPTFEWLPVENAISYRLLVSTVADFSSTVVNQGGITATSYTLGSPLSPNTVYYWRVEAVGSAGSNLTDSSTLTTGATSNSVPNLPTSVGPSLLTTGQSISTDTLNGTPLTMSLTDTDVSDTVRYRIQIATDNLFSATSTEIDYRSSFGGQGAFQYLFGENNGTYAVGSSSTTLSTGQNYYIRIRNEDDRSTESSWYDVSGVAFTLTSDTTAPIITINQDVEAGPVGSDTLEFSVSDEALGSLVNLSTLEYGYVATTGACNISATFGNTFSSGTPFTLTGSTNNGDYVCITAADNAGNIAYAYSTHTLNIDTVGPSAPGITSVTSDTSAPYYTNDTTPTISGTGEPNSTVTARDGLGSIIGTGSVNGSGNWTITLTSRSEGSNTVLITNTDIFSNEGSATSITVNLDTAAPSTPTVSSVGGDSTAPYLTNDTTPTIAGTGEPNSTIRVYTSTGVLLGTGTADGSGDYSFSISPSTLPQGSQDISITSTDAAGNEGTALVVSMSVDSIAPNSPVISSTDGDTTAPYLTNDDTPTISGTGEVDSLITIRDGLSNILATTTVGLDGTWSIDLSSLSEGTQGITLTSTDAAGNVSTQNAQTIEVDTIAPEAPTLGDLDGDTTAPYTTNDTSPTLTGTGELGTTITVRDSLSNILGTTTVGLDGTWSLTLSTLTEGTHDDITLTLTDTSGNEGDVLTIDLLVDITAPSAPAISSPLRGEAIIANTFTVSGTCETDATVTISNANITPDPTTTTCSLGAYSTSVAFTGGLDGTNQTLSITQTDPSGNESVASTVQVTVNTDGDIENDTLTDEDDADIDGDGIVNILDTDTDGDGIDNTLDNDDDNDGTIDTIDTTDTGLGDSDDYDGDGEGNDEDLDINGDGEENDEDSDVDGDGEVNDDDTDNDDDGNIDAEDETPNGNGTNDGDTDNDTIPDSTDPDMDGDGIVNTLDTDTDGDGLDNDSDNDDDNDGTDDTTDTTDTGLGDSDDYDGDGTTNTEDTDVDGDGEQNTEDTDVDGDGEVNDDDTDNDDDGNIDAEDETPNGNGTNDGDTDNDGTPDSTDPDMDGDDIVNTLDTDTDGDGIPNSVDEDSDNDGTDDDTDTTDNGLGDSDDYDGDGSPNDEDLDINGDGEENDEDTDTDGDGVDNDTDTNDDDDTDTDSEDETPRGNGTNDGDTDDDGTPDSEDSDIDDDGIVNILDDDTDGDGIDNEDDGDDDNDGLDDDTDTDDTGLGDADDYDGDGEDNSLDQDIDGDGDSNITDDDTDGDGEINDEDDNDDNDETDDDTDNDPEGPGSSDGDFDDDEIPDENDPDMDGDDIVNILDDDTDGDGTPNEDDENADNDDDNDEEEDDTDTTDTGLGDADDYDGDGLPNDEDDDMDGDGTINADDTDTDGDGVDDDTDTDDDNDGTDDIIDESPGGNGTNDGDTDDDGKPNTTDDDMDGDGIFNLLDDDSDGDGILNVTDRDDDNDGIPDEDDRTPSGYESVSNDGGGGGAGSGDGVGGTENSKKTVFSDKAEDADIPAAKEEKTLIEKFIEAVVGVENPEETAELNAAAEEAQVYMTKEIAGEEKAYILKQDFIQTCQTIGAIATDDVSSYETMFFDILGSSFAEYIMLLEKNGVVDGDGGKFYPTRDISRAEFLKILLKSHCYSYDEPVTDLPFIDVGMSTWESRVIGKGYSMGIISGETDAQGNKIFRPDDGVTRSEALKMMINLSVVYIDDDMKTAFLDVEGTWYEKYVKIGEYLGLVDAEKENYKYGANLKTRREEMAELIVKLAKIY